MKGKWHVMKNKLVWDKIKERKYEFPNKEEIFNLIESHSERIEFVRDHIGLRDFLFIAEAGTQGFYVSDLFVATDVEFSARNDVEGNDDALREKTIEDPMEVLEELRSFFANTRRTLYLGVGFLETTNQDLRRIKVPVEDEDGQLKVISLLEVKIIQGLQSGKYSSYQEAMKDLRVFPEWYTQRSVMPEETGQITMEDEKRTIMEDRIIQEGYLKVKINMALDQMDKEAFMTYSKQLNDLQENAG